MKSSHPVCVALFAVLLSGCGAGGPPTATSLQTAGAALLSTAANGRNLLYATQGGDAVYVYTFPHGKPVGLVSGALGSRGLCVDKSGDVFVPWVYNVGGVYEYAHGGGTPIAYLGVDFSWPNGCSVSPKTGTLAIVAGPQNGRAVIAVYHVSRKRGWGLSKDYFISVMATSDFCGYDDQGNLFVDGKDSFGNFVLAELPKGGKTFAQISVAQTIAAAGQVQWDGEHVAIGDTGITPSVIYQFDVNGSSAVEVGSTTLTDSQTVEQFWIQGNEVVAPDLKRSCGGSKGGCVALYDYPGGGNAVHTIALPGAFGATVSLAR